MNEQKLSRNIFPLSASSETAEQDLTNIIQNYVGQNNLNLSPGEIKAKAKQNINAIKSLETQRQKTGIGSAFSGVQVSHFKNNVTISYQYEPKPRIDTLEPATQ